MKSCYPRALFGFEQQQESTLGRLSGGVLGKKRSKSGKSPSAASGGAGVPIMKSLSGSSVQGGPAPGENCVSTRSYVSLGSVASVDNHTSSDESNAEACSARIRRVESMNSDASSYYQPASRGGTRSAFVTTASPAHAMSKPPSGPSIAVVAAAARRTHSAMAAEAAWASAGAPNSKIKGVSSPVVGTPSGRRSRRAKKEKCDVS